MSSSRVRPRQGQERDSRQHHPPTEGIPALSGRIMSSMHRMVVVLPAPVRVEEAEDLSLLHFQVNASQCLDLAISLGQSLHP